ncbi:MAG: phosphoribosylanthranilate isomerase [Campylobacterales bacterium]|nr:phosphoribosylanthranilate isomerase [Campylobacterales bacterium]
MPRVKICGITNLEDALSAIALGADALGFVFYPPSPRFVTPEAAAQIVSKLPPFVEKVGLFVEEEAAFVNATCKAAKLTLAQIHWDAPDAFYAALDVPFLPVVRVTCKEDLARFSGRYRLVDAFVEGYGGAGKRIEKTWFEGAECEKMIVAGGLEATLLSHLRPFGFYGYDVSSGVEEHKGKKSYQKMADFMQEANA